ncbi:hypothetical protein RJT34_30971 [Clitoria ternatea]|uniref:Uncharacterized protein n=1 Tax=Clitoria ternatea TaxID=43366 RepID=A0AAN9ETS9_CLITE
MNSVSSLWTFLFDAIDRRISSIKSLCFLIPCKDPNGKTSDDAVALTMQLREKGTYLNSEERNPKRAAETPPACLIRFCASCSAATAQRRR